MLWDLLRDGQADNLDSVREALEALRSHPPDPTAAQRGALTRLEARLLGHLPSPQLPELNEDASA